MCPYLWFNFFFLRNFFRVKHFTNSLNFSVKIVEEERCESCNTAFNLLRKGINSTAKRSKANPLIFRRQAYISHDRG